MFSSSILTAETPPPAHTKAGNAKAAPDRLAEGNSIEKEESGSFAKEFQAVVSDEQTGNSKLSASEPQVKSDNDAQLAEGTTEGNAEAEEQGSVSENMRSEEQVSKLAVSEEELSNSLIKNAKGDAETGSKQAINQQGAQISASQEEDGDAELDSKKKQQIMSDGEELLSRLSASNKQLAADTDGESVPEGKKLPPEQAAHQSGQSQVQQPTDVKISVNENTEVSTKVDTNVSADKTKNGNLVAGDVIAQNAETLTQAGHKAGILPAAQASAPASTLEAVAAQPTGLSQEELAKVFAVPEAQQLSSDAELADDQEASNTDATVMAMALASGGAAPVTSTEVKGAQSDPLPSDALQQSAGSKNAQLGKELLGKEQLVSAELSSSELPDGKGKGGNLFAQSALATATAAGVASNSYGQPQSLATDANPALAAGSGNPALSSAASTVAPGIVAPNAGTVEAQMAGAVGVAAGAAGLTTALKRAATDNGAEAKGSEVTHSLSGLTTQQGLTATAQARADAALAQSPMQLSKEQAGEQIAERMQMMMSKNLKHVDIRLDPPELGKLQIKLSLNQDQASVQFTVGNQQTRDLVEQAMPRLRELLNQQGLQLAQSSVQQDSSRQQFAGQSNQQNQGQQADSGGQQNRGSSQGQDVGVGGGEPVDMYVSQSTDRVDYYA
ncbi:flagellar hook-length control protein FliK [Photobacterium sp. SDRW27]|uniref:flagellar hook-length control protein FliK n=1 Tax=Photobacterium obscurum TaxID=2829490 RepID=UPI0022433F15|nr:flagellar hook-length control protein FliK [Photobacterium obscurum]MCW8328184.1 flagellar hook-length control protein FliK [Photobacterium obscurum]